MLRVTLILLFTSHICSASVGRLVPIFGNGTLGYYFVNVYLGPTHQKFSLIVDTGSSLTTLPCEECTDCGKNHYNKPFKHNQSPVFEYVNILSYFGWKCSNPMGSKCPFSIVGENLIKELCRR